MSVLQKIKELINENKLEEALESLDCELMKGENDLLYFERGKLHWRMGNKRLAISDYERAVALNAQSPAKIALENARYIMNFYDTNLYNP
ncbi:MAG: hypothetical protein E7081_06710 [Bacteroidales bacterium]|nr:hypothetical protein [Bacteroidales bacterium]